MSHFLQYYFELIATTVSNSNQAMAMIVSASTGGAKNLQQFEIMSFDFKQAAHLFRALYWLNSFLSPSFIIPTKKL